tara:strand:+ start:57 stop:641 length:585 start_codon:yes stop_codon:yes gene_type:complete
MKEVTTEKIEKNWAMFEKLCSKISDKGVDNLINTLGERIVMSPSAPKESDPGCFPGGLIQISLDTTITMKNLNSSLGFDLPMDSIIKVGLLHDIGKIGDETEPLFIDQDSDWHREKLGQHYKYSETISKMSTSHRTLYLLQKFGVSLSSDEWLAIQLAQGSHFEENRFYVGSEPTLGLLLQQSKSIVAHKSRNK